MLGANRFPLPAKIYTWQHISSSEHSCSYQTSTPRRMLVLVDYSSLQTIPKCSQQKNVSNLVEPSRWHQVIPLQSVQLHLRAPSGCKSQFSSLIPDSPFNCTNLTVSNFSSTYTASKKASWNVYLLSGYCHFTVSNFLKQAFRWGGNQSASDLVGKPCTCSMSMALTQFQMFRTLIMH